MCQLLGISANREVNIDFSMKEFKYRGRSNSHGWGFAFLENRKWKVIKKAGSMDDEDITQEQFKFKSKIIIGHVRIPSCGGAIHKNTHPFSADNWVFVHNGTVRDVKNYPLGERRPEGDTDSEYAFYYLMVKIRQDPSNMIKILKEESDKICKLGRFNFLMSDGKMIFAYGHDSLYYIQRKSPFGFVTLRDEQYEVNLADIKEQDEQAIIVATEPLTVNENWINISGLKVFENGELIKL